MLGVTASTIQAPPMKPHLPPVCRIAAFTLMTLAVAPANADPIDLQCNHTSADLVARLDAAGLLAPGSDTVSRAQAIAETVCDGHHTSARQQQVSDRKDLLSNILFEDTGGKPGNKRLMNLKR